MRRPVRPAVIILFDDDRRVDASEPEGVNQRPARTVPGFGPWVGGIVQLQELRMLRDQRVGRRHAVGRQVSFMPE